MIVKGEFFVAEKENASRLRAADFARICGTQQANPAPLRPDWPVCPRPSGENGYRYYSQEQYDVFMVIAALKELGMPLLDIKAYLDRRDPGAALRPAGPAGGGGGAGAGPAPADPDHNPHQAEAAGAGGGGRWWRPGVL